MRAGRAALFGIATVLFAAGVVVAGQPQQATYLVEIDAVVTDDAGKPMTGLRENDFQIKDDGRAVDIKTFEEVKDSGERPLARSIVVLLDDSGLGAGNTLPIQQVARMFVARMQPPDEFSVI